jgi:hypothetical protein
VEVPRGIVLDRELDAGPRGLADERERLALEPVVDELAAARDALDPERAGRREALEVPGPHDEHPVGDDRAGRGVELDARRRRARDGEVLRRAQGVLHERDGDAVAEVEAREHPDADPEDQRHQGHHEQELDQREARRRPALPFHQSFDLGLAQFPMSSSVPNTPSSPAEISW